MKVSLWPPCLLLLCCCLAFAGCFKADVRAPERISVGGEQVYGAPPPPALAQIPPANPNNIDDLRRENQQLRARSDYLADQNRRLARKYDDQAKDIANIQQDMNKIQAERDRYKRALGE